MKKLFLPLIFVLSSCATHYAKKSEADANYYRVERESQENSQERAAHVSKAAALNLKIRALDTQIANQQLVVGRWQALPEVPSSPAMIRNAEARLEALQAEKQTLLDQLAAELRAVEALSNH